MAVEVLRVVVVMPTHLAIAHLLVVTGERGERRRASFLSGDGPREDGRVCGAAVLATAARSARCRSGGTSGALLPGSDLLVDGAQRLGVQCRADGTGAPLVQLLIGALHFNLSGMHCVGVGVKAATDQRICRRLLLADEGMTLEHFDARGAAEDAGKEGRMANTPSIAHVEQTTAAALGEGAVQWQEFGHLVVGRCRRFAIAVGDPLLLLLFRNTDVADCGAVVQRLDGVKAADSVALVVDVLHQDAIRPDGEPGVDARGAVLSVGAPEDALLWVEVLQWLLNALQAVLGDVRHRRTEVQHSTAADGRRRVAVAAGAVVIATAAAAAATVH